MDNYWKIGKDLLHIIEDHNRTAPRDTISLKLICSCKFSFLIINAVINYSCYNASDVSSLYM